MMAGRCAVRLRTFSRAAERSFCCAASVGNGRIAFGISGRQKRSETSTGRHDLASVRSLHVTPIYAADSMTVEGPAFAESITEGDIHWLKAAGDYVKEDEMVAEIETDKTTVDVPAPHAGTIEKLLVEDGSTVEAKQALYVLALGGEAPPAKETKKEEKSAKTEKAAPAAPPAAAPAPAKPAPKAAPGVLAVEHTEPLKPRAAQASPAPAAPAPDVPMQGGETRVKMNRMRLRIAQRLKDAQNTYAMLTTFNEIDMSRCIQMRQQHKDAFLKRHGVKLGFMSPFIAAAAYALKAQPVVNAVIDEQDIVYRDYVDISVAVATPKGLVVPVLRNAGGMDCAQIEAELTRLGELARSGKLAIEDMSGGTFTISNGGVFGSLYGTPIVNPPQSAILGMHAIKDRPVVVNGKIEIRPMMTVALTYDHRLIDGREAVTFLVKIKQAVEDPAVMVLGL